MRNDEKPDDTTPIIYFGGASIVFHDFIMEGYDKKIPVLIPFDQFSKKGKIEWKSWYSHLFVDSGAFSVSQNNANVRLNDYIDFIKRNEDKITRYASLDVVGNGGQSLENWRAMRRHGLFPIPVYHDGEDIDILNEYVDNCSYVGLGAVAYKSTKSRIVFIDDIFRKFPNRDKIGFHGFGVMANNILKRYPWLSVDSSAIAITCRYGGVYMPFHIGKMVPISQRAKGGKGWKHRFGEEYLRNFFKEFGRDYDIATQSDNRGLAERVYFSLDYVMKYVQVLIPDEYSTKLSVRKLF